MGTLAAILSAITALGAIFKVAYDMWKKTFMKTEQEKIDDEKKRTDSEQQSFKDGKGGGDVEI